LFQTGEPSACNNIEAHRTVRPVGGESGEDWRTRERVISHLLGDAGGSIAVIVSTVVIEVTGIRIVDPITAALIAVVVTWSALKVLRGSGATFFHRMPFDTDEIRTHLLGVEGVEAVDDLHAWQICSQITVATTHVETAVDTMAEAGDVTRCVHEELAHHGVNHATVELCPAYEDRSTHLNHHTH